MKHLNEEELVLLYYGEPGAPAGAKAHVAACPECQAAAASLARTLDLCTDWEVPEPPHELERTVWAQIAPVLAVRQRNSWLRWSRWPLVFATLLLAAFLLGRFTVRPKQGPVITAGLSSQARERILRISLADHLDRANMLLTEISNVGDLDASERGRAQDLVEEGRLMRQTLAGEGHAGTLALVDDVERFMLEVANSSTSPAELRERIAAGSLLFKVRIIESNLRTEGERL